MTEIELYNWDWSIEGVTGIRVALTPAGRLSADRPMNSMPETSPRSVLRARRRSCC